jgi:hypothetical protein
MAHHQWADGLAGGFHRQLAVQKRMQQPARTQESATPEFVYSLHVSDYDFSRSTVAHRIVKKTKTRIYVERDSRPWREEALAKDPTNWWLHDVRTFVLDRVAFERDGEARSWKRYPYHFYTSPERALSLEDAPPALADDKEEENVA